jgi:hypothetical protein
MTKLEKKALILLTETETNQVAGGDKGNHYGQKRDPGVPAWTVNDNNSGNGNAANAADHLKVTS